MKKQIINLHTIAPLKEYGGAGVIQEAFDAFEQETKDLMKNLEQAICDNNSTQIKNAAHTIKGSAQTLGIEKVGESAKTIEQFSNNVKYKQVDLLNLFDTLKQDFSEFLTNYKAILKNGNI